MCLMWDSCRIRRTDLLIILRPVTRITGVTKMCWKPSRDAVFSLRHQDYLASNLSCLRTSCQQHPSPARLWHVWVWFCTFSCVMGTSVTGSRTWGLLFKSTPLWNLEIPTNGTCTDRLPYLSQCSTSCFIGCISPRQFLIKKAEARLPRLMSSFGFLRTHHWQCVLPLRNIFLCLFGCILGGVLNNLTLAVTQKEKPAARMAVVWKAAFSSPKMRKNGRWVSAKFVRSWNTEWKGNFLHSFYFVWLSPKRKKEKKNNKKCQILTEFNSCDAWKMNLL